MRMRSRGLAALLAASILSSSPCAAASRRTPVVEAVERVSPSVVNISTTQVVERDVAPFAMGPDPFFDQFFRDFSEPRRQRMTRSSLGSGVIIRGDGYIITNQHVLLRSARITVTLADQRELDATLVGADVDSDLAVLRVLSDQALPTAKIGKSSDLMIGETVIAIGNPFGLSHTVTTGVVSAVGRSMRTEEQVFYDLLQTDASINPGNSGGPLLNINGELIGINTAIYQKAQGIGFAIPIERAQRIVGDLISYGEVQPGWAGLATQDLTPDLAHHFGIKPGTSGVVVSMVEPDSPASGAGLRPGDVIIAFNGQPLYSADEWDSRLRDQAIGQTLNISAMRDGRSTVLSLKTSRYPDERADALAWQLGFRVRQGQAGVEIAAVRNNSPAAAVGIHPGDRIAALGGKPIKDQEAFRRALSVQRDKQRILVSVERGKRLYHVPLPLGGQD